MTQKRDIHIASLIERPNRFLGRLELNGEIVEAFIPNPGRMHEFMIPGKQFFIRHNPAPHRKTSYDLIGVKHEGVLVSLDSNLPNRFIRNLLEKKRLDKFTKYSHVISEPKAYGGRFDFLLTGDNSRTYIEVKSCTLVVNRRVLFPDAPTIRGARHMRHLAHALTNGDVNKAAVIFVVQRPDGEVFSPHDRTDPNFGNALRNAYAAGVQIIPLLTRVVDWNLELIGEIPFDLGPLSSDMYE